MADDMIQMQLLLPTARPYGAQTSAMAGANVQMRVGSQRWILLAKYAEHRLLGLTDEQAGLYTGLADKPGCCYWKRCSELRELGMIKVTDEKRMSRAGEFQRVCVISADGLSVLNSEREMR